MVEDDGAEEFVKLPAQNPPSEGSNLDHRSPHLPELRPIEIERIIAVDEQGTRLHGSGLDFRDAHTTDRWIEERCGTCISRRLDPVARCRST